MVRVLAGSATLAIAVAAVPAAATVTWVPDADGQWTVPANWSGGVLPGPLDNVVIDVGGDTQRTIRLEGWAQEIASLRSAERLVLIAPLTIRGAFSNTAETLVGAGTLRLDGQATLATLNIFGGNVEGVGRIYVSSASHHLNARFLGTGTTIFLGRLSQLNFGISLDGGRLLVFRGGYRNDPGVRQVFDLDFLPGAGGGVLRNDTGSEFEARAINTAFRASHGGETRFENAGIYRQIGGSTDIFVPFRNSGTVEVLSGTMRISGPVEGAQGTTLGGGKWIVRNNIDDGGTNSGILRFETGSGLTRLETLAADLTLDGRGASTSLFSGGSDGIGGEVMLNTLRTVGSGGTLRLINGGDIAGSREFHNDGLVQLNGGGLYSLTITNNGVIEGHGDVILSGQTLTNSGTIRAAGGRLVILSSFIKGGTLEIVEDASLSFGVLAPNNPRASVDVLDHRGTLLRGLERVSL